MTDTEVITVHIIEPDTGTDRYHRFDNRETAEVFVDTMHQARWPAEII